MFTVVGIFKKPYFTAINFVQMCAECWDWALGLQFHANQVKKITSRFFFNMLLYYFDDESIAERYFIFTNFSLLDFLSFLFLRNSSRWDGKIWHVLGTLGNGYNNSKCKWHWNCILNLKCVYIYLSSRDQNRL